MAHNVEIPENILCTRSHEYILLEENVAVVGITSYASEQLGEIVYVELPVIGALISKGDAFGTVESVKAASEVYMPVTGKIVEVNERLTSEPELINEDCYGNGWLVKIADFAKEDLENTLTMEDYLNYIEE
jgi:glycine cleavage system H protein